MNRGVAGLVGALGLWFWAAWASAHLGLTLPVSRYGAKVLKQGPCGVVNGERSDKVTVFEPGETILVRWEEYVDHPGHYRIAFDADGDDDFVDPARMNELYNNDTVLLDGIEDESATDPYYEVSVQLPSIECERCTLQVIQVMYDKEPYTVPGDDIYYQCADLVLRCPDGDPECDAETPNGAGGGGTAGAGGDWPSAGCADDGDDSCKQGSGCSLSPGAFGTEASSWAWLAGVLGALAYRRRRSRASQPQ